MKKNIDIELLRTIAIAFVLYAHLYNLFPWGQRTLIESYKYLDLWSGVDIFFCVSGYVIANSVIDKLPTERSWNSALQFTIPFLIRRAWRLWPAAWFFLTLTTILSIVFTKSGLWARPFENLTYQIYAMLHMANFYGFECKSIGTCGANQVYWSLAIEEQFYLIFPLIVLIFKKKYLPYVFLFIFIAQAWVDRGGSILGFIRTDAIALGVLIAFIQRTRCYKIIEPKSLSNYMISIPLSILLVVGIIVISNSRITIVPFSTGLIAFLSGILVWIASYNKGYLTQFDFIRNLSLLIGARSYSIYLSHIPAFFLTKEIIFQFNNDMHATGGSWTLRYSVLGMVVLIFLTEFSYRIIEQPLRSRGRDIAEQKKLMLD
ncbi:TPA: acyltransferase [Escherichia coli]|nr:acyltransferase [Escherichia coli]